MSTRSSPRILYVLQRLPHEASFGMEIRCLQIARALREIGTVEVMTYDNENRNGIKEADYEFPVTYSLDVKPRPNEGLIGKVRWTLDPRADYPHGCGVDHDAMRRVLRSLKDFDLVWFVRLRSPDMFPNAAWRRSVLDIDDVPSSYERTLLQVERDPRKRLLDLRRLFCWRRREKLLGERFTVLAVCSEDDKQYLNKIGVKSAVHVIPNGFDKPQAEPLRIPAMPPRIGFIGVFDYFPNRDGVYWFVNKCWPQIKRHVPDARLRLVGQDRDGCLKHLAPDVDRLGWLTNTSDEIKTWSAMVVPIRVGTGTRIKIAHGFSQKCPIVSTSLGAYGYELTDGREIYLADSAEAFSNACIRTIREPDKAAQMAAMGWRQFLQRWTWDSIRPQVWATAEDCLRLSVRG